MRQHTLIPSYYLLCRDEAAVGSADDDLFDWDPKEKQSSEPHRANKSTDRGKRKKKAASPPAKKVGRKAAVKELEGAADMRVSSCRFCAVTRIWQTWTPMGC